MNKIAKLENVSKNFYTLDGEINAIKNVSLDVIENEFLTIVGASGCGKSTLLNIIAGLDFPTSGIITYTTDKPVIGYMFQNDAMLPWLNILDNCTLGLKIMNNKNEETVQYTKELLHKYGLGDFIDKYPAALSGGMKQRCALIRTLAIKPDILLLDEPFSALDYQTRISVSEDVKKIIEEENKTVIMITHDIAEAISLSDRIIVLSSRPSTVKDIVNLNFDKEKTPTNRRSDNKFSEYYEKIWKRIDKN